MKMSLWQLDDKGVDGDKMIGLAMHCDSVYKGFEDMIGSIYRETGRVIDFEYDDFQEGLVGSVWEMLSYEEFGLLIINSSKKTIDCKEEYDAMVS